MTELNSTTFKAKLLAASRQRSSLVCVGLDPSLESLPKHLPRTAEGVFQFNRAIIEATSDLVCAYKPNLAFYEALGPEGLVALKRTVEAVPPGIPVIGDAKRGDIGHTARAYASALYDYYGFDAVTVSPYMGSDSIEPFAERIEKGVFVLCRTSNPGARELQDLHIAGKPLYRVVARLVRDWNIHDNLGAVAGATYPRELASIRSALPTCPILVPGVGAQAGDLRAAVMAGVDANGELAVINSSRAVIFASPEMDFAMAARTAAAKLRDEINEARWPR